VPTEASLVTPERILFSGEAAFVVLRSEGGEIMFLSNHAPYIGAVDISLVRIAPPGADEKDGSAASSEEFRAAVHGGFVHVANNKVTILASVAEPADEIDVARARRAFEAAQAAVSAGEEPTEHREATAAVASPEGEAAEEPAELSPTMRALLYPDDPEVALRRATVRLEATGEGDLAASAATH
jgi:F-type H+-transporting ATPase subunit epsilon